MTATPILWLIEGIRLILQQVISNPTFSGRVSGSTGIGEEDIAFSISTHSIWLCMADKAQRKIIHYAQGVGSIKLGV